MSKWMIVLLFFVTIAGGMAYYYYQNNLRFKVWTVETFVGEDSTTNFLPEELSELFDPTENRGVYRVEEKNVGEETLIIRRIWPAQQVEVVTKTNLECERGIKVVGGGMTRMILTQDFWTDNLIQESELMLSGYCSGTQCEKLVGECEATLIEDGL